MAHTHESIRAAVVLLILVCMASTSFAAEPIQAQSSEEILFKRIGILDPEDRTRQAYAKRIGIQMRRELARTFRFEIVPQPRLSKELPLSAPDLIVLGKKFKLDGFITGRVEITGHGLKLELTLLEAKTAVPLAREFIVINNFKSQDAVEKNVRVIMAKLIHRIPYQAVVTGVGDKGKTIVIDAGQLNGLGIGMKVRVFGIGKLKKNPFTGELIGIDEVAVGELTVVRADERVSLAKPFRLKKGRNVAVGQYVGFEPSGKVLSRIAHRREEILARQEREWAAMDDTAQREAARKEAAMKEKQARVQNVPKVRLELDGGLARSDYSLNAEAFGFNQKISSLPLIRMAGEYWVIRSIGIDADYQIGFFKLENLDNTSINVRARPNWTTANLKFRHIFRPGRTDLQLIGRVGYAWYTYRLSETDSQFLINTRYQGPSVGFEGRLPLTENITATLGADYRPVMMVSEHPATSGEDASAWSVEVHAEGLYHLYQGLWMSIRYLFEDFTVTYSGTGTRSGGVSGAKTRDELNGVMFGLVAEF